MTDEAVPPTPHRFLTDAFGQPIMLLRLTGERCPTCGVHNPKGILGILDEYMSSNTETVHCTQCDYTVARPRRAPLKPVTPALTPAEAEARADAAIAKEVQAAMRQSIISSGRLMGVTGTDEEVLAHAERWRAKRQAERDAEEVELAEAESLLERL